MNEDILHLGYLVLRLSREKERKENGEQDIKNRIYLLHADGKISLSIDEESQQVTTYNSQGILINNKQIPEIEKPEWVKKLEKDIVKKTHPDKLIGMNSNEIKERTELFIRSKEKIEKNQFIDLLPIALSLGIDFSKYTDDFIGDINKRIIEIQREINKIMTTISWQWQEYNEEQKINAIELILKNSGIQRNRDKIKEAVNRRIKRPVGTRPKTMKELRNQK